MWGSVFWTGSLKPQPSSAIQKTPGVFKILHPGSPLGGGGGFSSATPSRALSPRDVHLRCHPRPTHNSHGPRRRPAATDPHRPAAVARLRSGSKIMRNSVYKRICPRDRESKRRGRADGTQHGTAAYPTWQGSTDRTEPPRTARHRGLQATTALQIQSQIDGSCVLNRPPPPPPTPRVPATNMQWHNVPATAKRPFQRKCPAIQGAEGGEGWHEAMVLVCLPLAVPIGPLPSHIPTLCGSERVLVVSTEPPDDLSCLTTPGVGRPRDGLLPRAVDQGHPGCTLQIHARVC